MSKHHLSLLAWVLNMIYLSFQKLHQPRTLSLRKREALTVIKSIKMKMKKLKCRPCIYCVVNPIELEICFFSSDCFFNMALGSTLENFRVSVCSFLFVWLIAAKLSSCDSLEKFTTFIKTVFQYCKTSPIRTNKLLSTEVENFDNSQNKMTQHSG